MRCPSCGGASHPATGSVLPSGEVVCGPCVRRFWGWASEHGKKTYRVGKKGKGSKYIAFPTGITKKNGRFAGRFHYLHSCPSSTYEDIQALKESEQAVTLATFRTAVGLEQWREIRRNLGYDYDLPISKDWHVGYYKSIYRHVPAYFLRHSGIEHIFTLDGERGPSLA